ncbi:cadherin repeat domain-containing protein [Limnohabitans sp. DCL3]|uniref:cadherin repeat domain-containing protein n=1 Tax=Limnohabitans sp. DCL3 TaxID=3374103 RepID=UPI003A8B6DFE
MSYSLTDPVTGKVIEPQKVRQNQGVLEITLPDDRLVLLDDFFIDGLGVEGEPLLRAQAEFVFYTGPGATPYWVVDPLANLSGWTLDSVTPIWPSQDRLGVPQWMNAQGLSSSALIAPPAGGLVLEAALGSELFGALGGLGLAAAAGVSGGGGGGAQPPVFTSSNRVNVDENSSTSLDVYTAAATAGAGKTITYSISGPDAARFTFNPISKRVTFNAVPDADAPRDAGGDNVYNFTVTATDSGGLQSTQSVLVTVLDLPDQAPIFISGNTLTVAENTAVSSALLTVNATPDVAGKAITYSLGGVDADKFTWDPLTRALRFNSIPDHEAPGDSAGGSAVAGDNIYELLITAAEEGNVQTASQTITLIVTDLPDSPPVIVGGAAVPMRLAENVLTSIPVYTVSATPDVFGNSIRYSLKGDDAALFRINASGEVTFQASPDFEDPKDVGTDNVYHLVIDAMETANGVDTRNQSSQALRIEVTDVGDALIFTSPSAVSVSENHTHTSYTAAALIDSQSVTYRYTLGQGGDEGLFNLNPVTGVLTFRNAPDYENPLDGSSDNVHDVQVIATSTRSLADGTVDIQTAIQTVQVTVTDVGQQPMPTSALGGVQHLDVQSDVVINFAAAVNLTSNNALNIRIVCDSANARSFAIALTDTRQVSLSADGLSLVINPMGDLDFGSQYHIEVDAGAFISRADPSGTPPSFAYSNLATFSTVAPSRAGTASQKMTSTGALVGSQTYMDITGVGDANAVDTRIDMGTGNITLVYKDGNPLGGTANTTGLGTGAIGFNLQVKNWAQSDFLYFDDPFSGPNSLSANLTESFGGLQDGNIFNNSATAATQVPNFVGLLQIDPGDSGHAWIGFGVASPGYGGLDGVAFKNTVISG